MTSTQLFMDSQDDFILQMEQEYRAALVTNATSETAADQFVSIDLEEEGFMVESRVATSMAAEATESELASLLIGEELTSVELTASGIGALISEGVGGMSLMSGSIALFSASAAVLGVALTVMEIGSAMDNTVRQNNLKKRTLESQLKLQATRVIAKEYPTLYKTYMKDLGYGLTNRHTGKLHYAKTAISETRTDNSFNTFLDEFIKSSVESEWNHHSPGEHINGELNDMMPPNAAIRSSINSALSLFMSNGNILYKRNFVNDMATEASNENKLRLRNSVDAINNQTALPTDGFQADSAYFSRNDIYAQLLKSQVDIDWANSDSTTYQNYNHILTGFHNEQKWIDYKNAAKIKFEKELAAAASAKEPEKEKEKEVTEPSTDGDVEVLADGARIHLNPTPGKIIGNNDLLDKNGVYTGHMDGKTDFSFEDHSNWYLHRADENKIQPNQNAASTNEDDSHANAASTDSSNDTSAVHFPTGLDHSAHTMSGHHAGMIKPKYALVGGNKRTGRRLMDVGGAGIGNIAISQDKQDMFSSFLLQTTSIPEFNEIFTPSYFSALQTVLPENNGVFDQCLRTITYVSIFFLYIFEQEEFGSGLNEMINICSAVERIRLYTYAGMPSSFYSKLAGFLQWIFDAAFNNLNGSMEIEISENYIEMIIERVCSHYGGTFESLITNNKNIFNSLKSDKTELEWLESVDNFSAFLMTVYSTNIIRDNNMYKSLPYSILYDKNNNDDDDQALYREWLFDSEIANPPLLNLQTEKNDQSSSTKSLAQLLKNIGVVGVIELPELLSQKSNKFIKNPKSQKAKQTENVDDNNDDDNQEEEKSDEDESEKEETDQDEGVYGKQEGDDRDLSESNDADIDDDEDDDEDDEDGDFFLKHKSPVKRFEPSKVVKPAIYTPEEMSQNGVFALSAYEQPNHRPLKLHGSELSQTLSTDDIAVYVNKNGRVHIGVRGTSPGSNLFETMSSVYNSSDKHSLTEMEQTVKKEIDDVREAFPKHQISFWGHSHGAQLISVARQENETATTYAGYLRDDTGKDVTTNFSSKNDMVIKTLSKMHTQSTNHEDIEKNDAGHQLEDYIDPEELVAYKAQLMYRKAQNRGYKERIAKTTEDVADTLEEGGELVAEVGAAAVVLPEASVVAAAVIAYKTFHKADDAVSAASKAYKEVKEDLKWWQNKT